MFYACSEHKGVNSVEVTARLVCVFVFACADCWLSHEMAHLSYSHTVTFRGLRFTTFPSPTFCPKFVRFCRLLGFSTFIAMFCDLLLRIATYCPVIQRLRATVSLGIGMFSYVFTTCRYVFLRFSRFYQVITT